MATGMKTFKYGIDFNVNKQNLNTVKTELMTLKGEIDNLFKNKHFSEQWKQELPELQETVNTLSSHIDKAWNNKLGQLNLNTLNKGIESSWGSIDKLYEKMNLAGGAGKKAFDQMALSILHTNVQMRNTSKWAEELGQSLTNTIKWGISSSVFNNVTGALQKSYSYAQNLDKSLNNIKIVAEDAAGNMEQFAKHANEAAKNLGASTLDYTNAALIYYQQGDDSATAQAKADITLKAANVTGQSGQAVSEQLTSVWNGYKVDAAEAELYVDKLAAVAATTASDLEELSTGMSKVASAANLMGVDVDQLNASLATVISVTRQAPESVGTAFKTIYARMGDIESGLDAETTLGEYTSKMQAIAGINVLDTNNQLRDMGEVIEEVGSKWSSLSREQQIALAQAMAGTRQYNNLLSLFDNWNMYTDALNTSKNAAGALQEQQDIYMESTAAHLQKLSTEVERTYDIIFDESVINGLADVFTGLLTGVNNFFDSLGGGLPLLASFANNIMMLSNKQIAKGIEENIIENIESSRNNKEQLKMQEAILARYNVAPEDTAKAVEMNPALAAELKYAEEIYKLRRFITNEEAKQLTTLQERLGVMTEELHAAEHYKQWQEQVKASWNHPLFSSDQLESDNLEDWQKIEKDALRDFQKQDVNLRYISALKTKKSSLSDEKFKSRSALTQLQSLKNVAEDSQTYNLGKLQEEFPDLVGKKEDWDHYVEVLQKMSDLSEQGQLSSKEEKKMYAELEKTYSKLKMDNEDLLKLEEEIKNRRSESYDIYKKTQSIVKGIKKDQELTEVSAEEQKEQLQNELDLAIAQEKRQKKIALTIQGISAIGQGLSSIMSTVNILQNKELSFGEKVSALLVGAVPLVMSVAQGWNALKEANDAVVVAMARRQALEAMDAVLMQQAEGHIRKKTVEKRKSIIQDQYGVTITEADIKQRKQRLGLLPLETTAEGAVTTAKGAETTATGLLTVAQEKLNASVMKFPLMWIIAAVAAVAGIAVWALKSYQSAEEKAASALEEVNKNYQELSTTVSNYENAKKGIEGLTEGTLEWYEAIQKANEEAEKLIKQWDLVAGKDYTLGSGGLIQIDEKTLKTKQFQEQQKVFRAQANVQQLKVEMAQESLDRLAESTMHKINARQDMKDLGASLTKEDMHRIFGQYQEGEESSQSLGSIFSEQGVEANQNLYKIIDISEEIKNNLPDYQKLAIELQNLTALYGGQLIQGYGTEAQVDAYSKATAEQQKAISVLVAEGVQAFDDANKNLQSYRTWGDRILDTVLATAVSPLLGAGRALYDIAKTQENAKVIKDAYAKSVMGWTKIGEDWFDEYGSLVTDQYEAIKAKDIQEDYNNGEFETQSLLQAQLDELTQIKINTSAKGFNKTSQDLVANAIFGLRAGTATKKDFELLTDKEKAYIQSQFAATSKKVTETVYVPNEKGKPAQKKPEDFLKDAREKQQGKGPVKEDLYGKTYEVEKVITSYNGLHENISAEQYEKWTTPKNADDDTKNADRLEYQMQQYTSTLMSQAEALDTTTKSLELYGYALEKSGEISKERSAETAEQTADLYKFNKAFNDARKVYKDNKDTINDYIKALKQQKAVSYDVADAMAELIEPLEQMLGFKMDPEFIDEYSEQIKKMVSGTEKEAEEAYKILTQAGYKKVLEDAFDVDLSLPIDQLSSDAQKANDILSSINKLTPGDKLSAEMTKELLKMVNNAKMTAAEVQNLFKGLHLEVPPLDTTAFKESSKKTEPKIKFAETPESTKKHTYDGQMPNPHYNGWTDKKETIPVKYSWTETIHAAKVPYISWTDDQINQIAAAGLSSTGGGSVNFAQTNLDRGSGSDSKPKVEEFQEDEKDIYHDVNIELAKINNNIEKLQTQEEQLVGQSKIDNLREQYALLNKEIEKTGEKIDIAKGEMNELQEKLSSQGVSFNADGTISNYSAAYDAQLAHLNAVISHYNSLSAKGQESYQQTLDDAKEGFKKFTEDIERYDEILTDMIPGLEADIQDAINEQIEMKIEAFHQEIEIRLDMAEAEREWNEFYKNIIKDIDEDDILGNATERLKDFMSYYKESAEGVIQVNTEHINQILSELKAMDENGVANVYGKDETEYRKQALEDLQNYYQQLMSDLTDIHDLSDEIHESYVDMIDEAQEKFDEQIETFERVNELLEHDKNVISMIYGEESYSALAQYYDKQEENNNKQLDFQKQQVEFWKQQMEIAEEGSDAWEAAKENWMSAVDEWNSAVEAAIENLQEKYLNAINAIFQNLNNQVTNGLGLDYTESQWELINKNADQYLDSVNSIYQVQQLQNKYLDAIEKTDSPAQQKRLNDLMKQETDYLREQDKLSQYDLDRANLKYEIALKQMALEEAQQNKTMLRLRRDSQGNYTYQYTADEDQLSSIQQEIADLYNQLYNLDAEEYRGNLEEIYDVWLEFQERMAEAAQINDPEQRAAKELLIKEQYGELINTLVEKNENAQANLYQSTMSHLFDLYNQNIVNYDEMSQEQRDILDQFMSAETDLSSAAFDNLFNLYNVNIESFKTMTDEQQEILMGSLVPQWNTAVQMMVDNIAGAGGFVPTCKEAFEEIDEATQDYMTGLEELQKNANVSFDELKDGIDETIIETEKLLEDNNELISSYEQEIEAIRGVIDELEELISKYQAASDAAKKATEDAYNYWLAEQDKNATIDATLPDPNEGTATTDNTPINNQPAAPIETPKPSLNVGSYVNVKAGSRWYRTSYGGGDGPARSGSIVLTHPGSNYPYNIDWLGWVSKSAIQGYDTGGYTGDWGSKDGRLAMLHQKELVLNASDTQNVLNAVEILRDITSNLGNTLFSRMAAISAGGASAIANGVAAEGIEQNVHIDAQFPNVTNSHEIEDALNNLMNRASQFIQQSR